jgi:hypothetical protein
MNLHHWPHLYLFLFSHMRSYSSLLSHVLGSHREVSGYVETHLKYRSRLDLVRLRWHVAMATGAIPTGRYLLDKLLHNFMLIPRQLRDSQQLRTLIFVRKPEATLRSILHLGAMRSTANWYTDQHRVAEYYCARLAWLAAVGAHLRERAFVFPAEALLDDTDALLLHVANHLGLATPLQPHYQVMRLSGEPGYGDVSTNIKSGAIRRGDIDELQTSPSIQIDPALLDRCNRAYRACMMTLVDWCPSLPRRQILAPQPIAESLVA